MAFADLLAAGDQVTREILGEPLVYTPGVGEPVTVNGIFDQQYEVVDGGAGQAGVSSSGPAVFFTLSDLPSDPRIDEAATVTRNSIVYVAHEVKPDGLGGVVMLLHFE